MERGVLDRQELGIVSAPLGRHRFGQERGYSEAKPLLALDEKEKNCTVYVYRRKRKKKQRKIHGERNKHSKGERNHIFVSHTHTSVLLIYVGAISYPSNRGFRYEGSVPPTYMPCGSFSLTLRGTESSCSDVPSFPTSSSTATPSSPTGELQWPH
jgi:hypothetical protein